MSNSKFMTLADLLVDYEADRLARTRAEIAKEDAVWAALPQDEKDRIIAEREAKFAAMANVAEDEDEDEDEETRED